MNRNYSLVRSMVLLTSLWSLPVVAMAESASDGLYAGANLGWSQYYNNNDFTGGHDNNSVGFDGYIGYQFNPWLSLENGLSILGKAKGAEGLSMDVQGYQFSGKISYPLSNTNIYSRLGGMWYRSDVNSDDTNNSQVGTGIAPLAAIGMEYVWSANVASRVEYQWIGNIKNDAATSANIDNGFLSVGFSYHFGQQSSQSDIISSTLPEQKVTAPVEQKTSQELALFYGFNEYTLSPSNQQKISDYLHDLKKLKGDRATIKLALHGYSDTLGSEKNNIIISRKRAVSVKDFLMTLGIREENISVKPEGSTSIFTEQPDSFNNKETALSIRALAKNRQTLIISY